jgi:NHL repeat
MSFPNELLIAQLKSVSIGPTFNYTNQQHGEAAMKALKYTLAATSLAFLAACGGGGGVSEQGGADGRVNSVFYAITTIAGLAGQPGSADGTGNAARFNYPSSAAVDSSGNLYVADYGNNTIRKITSSGVVTTIAGASGQAGSANGTGNAARFDHPISTSIDSSGNIYVADHVGHTIRKIVARSQ